MKLQLPNAISTRLYTKALVAQKHSPQVLFSGGLVLMGATVVSACRGTLKLEGVLDDIRKDRDDLETVVHNKPEKYTSAEVKKISRYITARGAVRVAKLYTPALILGSLAVAALTSSHHILNKRNAGLSAALAATDRALNAYRDRIREAYGEDRELELYRGERTEKVAILDDEGRETKSTKNIKTGGGYSPYARVWGRDTTNEWDPQPEYNLAKLRSVQEIMTMRLNHRGHVFLNEVHDELGLDRTPAGSQVGWLSIKNGGVDGAINLGVMAEGNVPKFLDFVTGREDHILLDFNVDGEIWRKI